MNDQENTRDKLIEELVTHRQGNNPIYKAFSNNFHEHDAAEKAKLSIEQNYQNLAKSVQEGILIVNPVGKRSTSFFKWMLPFLDNQNK